MPRPMAVKKFRGTLALTDISPRRIFHSFFLPGVFVLVSARNFQNANRQMQSQRCRVPAEPETGRDRGRLSSFSIVRCNTRIRARLRGRIFFLALAPRVAESCAGTDRRPRIFDDYRSVCNGSIARRRSYSSKRGNDQPGMNHWRERETFILYIA